MSRFLNHSCVPNAIIRPYGIKKIDHNLIVSICMQRRNFRDFVLVLAFEIGFGFIDLKIFPDINHV